MLGMISTFLNILKLVLHPNVWSILTNDPCALEKNVHYLLCDEMLWRYQLNPSDLVSQLRRQFPCWFSIWTTYPLNIMGVKIFCYDCVTVSLSLYVHQDLHHLLRCSYVGCINVYKSYILLLDCSLYHYAVTFFVSSYSLCFKAGVSRLLASLPHTRRRRVILGHILNTLWHIITHTKKSHNGLSKFTILCWATFTAILGCVCPTGHRLDTTVKVYFVRYKYCYSSIFSICMKYLFPSFYF